MIQYSRRGTGSELLAQCLETAECKKKKNRFHSNIMEETCFVRNHRRPNLGRDKKKKYNLSTPGTVRRHDVKRIR